MRAEPFFTIVVPTYNRADLIGATLKTLQQQTYQHYEIIVVDDGSTDNTEEVVTSLAHINTHYVKKNNAERAAARNFGAAMAKGDYVNFFDSDDLALENHLSEAAALIAKQNNPEWLHLGYAWAEPGGQIFRETNNFNGPSLNHLMFDGNPLSCNGVFIRKDIIQQHKFNEDRELSASEDYELWCRLSSRFPLYYSNVITSVVVDHELRSVRTINGEKLIKRLNLLVHYLEQDKEVETFFGKGLKRIKMESHSYIALHLAELPAFKIKSISYLLRALGEDTALVKRRRFYAIIKNILLKW